MKSPVKALSDDEDNARECKRRRTESDSDEEKAFFAVPGCQKVEKVAHAKKTKQPKEKLNAVALRTALAKLVQKRCRCGHSIASKGSCLMQFRSNADLEALCQLRLQIGNLSKQDFDNKLVELLTMRSDSGRKGQVILSKPVCQHAFRSLLGIGSGRYSRLKKAATKGVAAPLDGRTLRRGKNICIQKNSIRKRSLVIEFLTELYNTVSEPMPEAGKVILDKVQPSESETHGNEASSSKPLELKKFRRSRGRRPRLAAQLHRGNIHRDMRVLPPGSFTDYLVMLKARHPTEKFGLKFFTRESWLHYVGRRWNQSASWCSKLPSFFATCMIGKRWQGIIVLYKFPSVIQDIKYCYHCSGDIWAINFFVTHRISGLVNVIR